MNVIEDVTIEILSRLPVTCLLRFKSVCKSWSLILHSPTFISKHHDTNPSKQGSNQPVLISRRDKDTNKRVISLMSRNGNDTTNFLNDQHHLLTRFLNDMFGHVRLIGPCNGIVCLYGFPDNIAVWNPSIREFRLLPSSTVLRSPDIKIRGGDLGVGFDSTTRDLKVLQILFCVSNGRLVYQVEIYSLGTNSWRKYDSFVPGNIIMYHNTLWSMVYKNEIFCWWAQDSGSNLEVILSFDMKHETFQNTPLPTNVGVLGGQPRITRAILPLEESLALIVYHIQELEKYFDIWILNDLGGNVDSWNKLMSIGPLSRVQRPLGFWNKDDFILESIDGGLLLYNGINKKIKFFEIYGKRNRLEVLIHKESLFSVNKVCANQ